MGEFPDFANLANARSIESLYRIHQENPMKIDSSWRHFFEGLDFWSEVTEGVNSQSAELFLKVYRLIGAYRKYGHLMAKTNPVFEDISVPEELELSQFGLSNENLTQLFPTCNLLEEEMATLQEIIDRLQKVYCQKIGFEYVGIENSKLEKWIQETIEAGLDFSLDHDKAIGLFQSLVEVEGTEIFIHTKYAGQKRFSIEGGATLIPLIQEMIKEGSELGLEEMVIAMPHRGRLNVLANILKKPYSILLYEFEDAYEPFAVEGTGDTSYHKGYSNYFPCEKEDVHIHLSANPSHLESVYPVAIGETKAKQVLKNTDKAEEKVAPLIMHGDASFSSQGVIYETMQMYDLPGYRVGGTIHVVVNNQLGFTTAEDEERSTKYCTDIAKGFGFPVFHVNAEDPIACLVVAKLAMQVRQKFQVDVVIDLIGYRKYGHNEGDEPSFTQPKMYEIIRKKKSILELFKQRLLSEKIASEEELNEQVDSFKKFLNQEQEIGKTYAKTPPTNEQILGKVWAKKKQPDANEIFQAADTKVAEEQLRSIIQSISHIPEGFAIHPKLSKWVANRQALASKQANELIVDWGLAEYLAFGSLLLENTAVRLAGQDTIRGTFSHRHAGWIDSSTQKRHFSLEHLSDKQARCDVVNSPLSELAALGFEYGYSLSDHNALVVWEAQYGDFANGAQIIIDQYIVSGEQKWGRFSGLTLFLPHGFEGKGPEHSSGRMERYLNLSANLNIQVMNLTTPSQFFHALRRQGKRCLKKPLVIFTPKNLLRHPKCLSSLSELSTNSFEELLDDTIDIAKPKRLILCSGRVFYELLEKREEARVNDVAIVRIEQIYPLHKEKMQKIFDKYKNVQECCWVQEEPENMGAWSFLAPQLRSMLNEKCLLNYIGRGASASPAVGSVKVHNAEREKFLNEALFGK